MQIVFFGTPYYVVPILDSLNKAFREKGVESPIAAVITASPKPVGRKKIFEYSPVDTWAHKRNVPKFFEPGDVVSKNIKADIGILASYGAFIPQSVIDRFPYGILVVHPSLLPEFRWASPVPAAIVTNTNPTGVSIIKMDDKWDHGPIVTQYKREILPNDTYESLRDRLFESASEVLVQLIPAYIKGKINIKPQDDSKATFARIITKDDAFIQPEFINDAMKGQAPKGIWNIGFIKGYETTPSAEVIERFVRAMTPWPIAWTNVRIKKQETRIKIIKAHLDSGKLVLDAVQLEGKNPVTWEEFKRGYPDFKL